MLITLWLSAMEKQGLGCFVHLYSLSMAGCPLKAYGLKWQWRAGHAKAISSYSYTHAGNLVTVRGGREDRKDRGVIEYHSASKHIDMDCWIYIAEWSFRYTFLGGTAALGSEILSLKNFKTPVDSILSGQSQSAIYGNDFFFQSFMTVAFIILDGQQDSSLPT